MPISKEDRQVACYPLVANEYDTGLDLYRERAKQIMAKAEGSERLAYEIFGSDIIGSLAFALDPSKKFRFKQHKIAPIQRHRPVACIYFQQRYGFRREVRKTQSMTLGKGLYAPLTGTSTSTFVADDRTDISLDDQQAINGFISDTTRHTRGQYFSQGECEMYFPKIVCASSKYKRVQNRSEVIQVATDLYQNSVYSETVEYGFGGPSARLSREAHDTWLNQYRTYALNRITEHAFPLAAQCMPGRRRYSLVYSVAELRDLPRTLRDSMAFFQDIFGHVRDLKSLGDLYLMYRFSYESTVKDVMRLLEMPAKISADVNRLLSRSGKSTTFRSRRVVNEKLATLPGFTTEVFDIFDESGASHSSNEGFHSWEVRVAINLRLQLPYVDIPGAEKILLVLQELGALPSPSDIYNLIPWTWLIDWFTGVSDYLEAVEAITFDESLINYGLVTFASKGYTQYAYHGISAVMTDKVSNTPPVPPRVTSTEQRYLADRSAKFSFKYQRRRDVMPFLTDVKNVSDETNLSPYQKSIVAALVAKYGDKAATKTAHLKK